jgi:hypothetical protein
VHREYREWTRARWDHALAELATVQQVWQCATTLNRLDDLMGIGDGLGSLVAVTADGDETE